MRLDDMDRVLREALHQEVSETAYRIEGLEDRITASLSGRAPNPGFLGALKQLLAPSTGGRVAQLAVVGATAACFLLVGALVVPRVAPTAQPDAAQGLRSALDREDATLFLVPAPGAESVTVLGNFNGWTATPLSDPDEDGIWTATIELPPGRYEYAYLVDGRWWGQDPLADEYVRSFGEYNSVRYVERVGDGA
ncbi:MAG: isoamylase early set domain-containing protein [Candidatus Bipolaricaulota bacterium]|nr:MAG: isoamylase early set domain-containing protein [Candidatus Bipolaricaulota bacterium]